MPRHILLVSNTAQSLWNFRRDVIADMIKTGHHVTCVAVSDGAEKNLRDLGVNFISVSMSRAGINPFSEIALLFHLFKILMTQHPDCIISYTIKPNAYMTVLSKLMGIPCLAVVTGLGYAFLTDTLRARLARSLLKMGLIFARHIWFLNKDDAAKICAGSSILTNKSSILEGEGIDTHVFDDALYVPPPEKPFVFLMIARILKDKGIYEFAGAAKRVKDAYPDTVFRVVGALDSDNPAGLSSEEWKALCAQCGLEYMGVADDVRPLLAAAQVCVLPSYREGIPRALLEAASMRRPLIATDVAGCRDVVRENITGFLVQSHDVKVLAEAMIKMLSLSADDFASMKRAARHDVQNRFGIDIIIKRYRDIIKAME